MDRDGAHARIRTGDLFLTKEMLYRLSYVGGRGRFTILSVHHRTPLRERFGLSYWRLHAADDR